MRLPRKHAHARLEMLPLMDIVFLLLVFLVYAMLAMAVYKAMPVALPASSTAETSPDEALDLTIGKDGALWLNRRKTTLDTLAGDLGSLPADAQKERIVRVFADARLPYQTLFKVLDVLKKAGLKKISLQAREES